MILEFIDRGVGMSAEVVGRMFDPFFTDEVHRARARPRRGARDRARAPRRARGRERTRPRHDVPGRASRRWLRRASRPRHPPRCPARSRPRARDRRRARDPLRGRQVPHRGRLCDDRCRQRDHRAADDRRATRRARGDRARPDDARHARDGRCSPRCARGTPGLPVLLASGLGDVTRGSPTGSCRSRSPSAPSTRRSRPRSRRVPRSRSRRPPPFLLRSTR